MGTGTIATCNTVAVFATTQIGVANTLLVAALIIAALIIAALIIAALIAIAAKFIVRFESPVSRVIVTRIAQKTLALVYSSSPDFPVFPEESSQAI